MVSGMKVDDKAEVKVRGGVCLLCFCICVCVVLISAWLESTRLLDRRQKPLLTHAHARIPNTPTIGVLQHGGLPALEPHLQRGRGGEQGPGRHPVSTRHARSYTPASFHRPTDRPSLCHIPHMNTQIQRQRQRGPPADGRQDPGVARGGRRQGRDHLRRRLRCRLPRHPHGHARRQGPSVRPKKEWN